MIPFSTRLMSLTTNLFMFMRASEVLYWNWISKINFILLSVFSLLLYFFCLFLVNIGFVSLDRTSERSCNWFMNRLRQFFEILKAWVHKENYFHFYYLKIYQVKISQKWGVKRELQLKMTGIPSLFKIALL